MDQERPQSNTRSHTSKLIIPIAVIIIILGIVVFASSNRKKEDAVVTSKTEETNTPTGEAMQEPPTESPGSSNDNTDGYKDGTYEATGDYISPGGSENLGVKITLKDGIITDADVESKATRPTTVKFQGIFVSNYSPLVVGKNIDDVELTTVSGSSLSPKGFNEALAEIKEQAS